MIDNTIKRPQYKEIIQAIYEIAQAVDPTVNGQPAAWAGTKKWEVPTADQYQAVGSPYLAVRFGTSIGYGEGGTMSSADQAARQPSAAEPIWRFEVFSFHPYDEDEPNYDDAVDDMINLWLAFMQTPELNGTCDESYVAVWEPTYVELDDQRIPTTAAHLEIHAFEFLLTNFA